MSSKLHQLVLQLFIQSWRPLANYVVKASVVNLSSVKTVWSTPEHLRHGFPEIGRYTNVFLFNSEKRAQLMTTAHCNYPLAPSPMVSGASVSWALLLVSCPWSMRPWPWTWLFCLEGCDPGTSGLVKHCCYLIYDKITSLSHVMTVNLTVMNNDLEWL